MSAKYVCRTLVPGKPGTKKLTQKYGDRLLKIRYRYHPDGKNIKTVELVESVAENGNLHCEVDDGYYSTEVDQEPVDDTGEKQCDFDLNTATHIRDNAKEGKEPVYLCPICSKRIKEADPQLASELNLRPL